MTKITFESSTIGMSDCSRSFPLIKSPISLIFITSTYNNKSELNIIKELKRIIKGITVKHAAPAMAVVINPAAIVCFTIGIHA